MIRKETYIPPYTEVLNVTVDTRILEGSQWADEGAPGDGEDGNQGARTRNGWAEYNSRGWGSERKHKTGFGNLW